MALLVIPPLLVVIYTIYHIINQDDLSGSKKIIWMAAVLLLNIFGCLFYWLIGREKVKVI
ncbi:PLDc N-terminal domain-containing protein [Sphingobacterium sp. JUb20]|uniref:PLDc N-terminal domain-containing protein n=1 Tax=unclassified Sphingobacterium TaxID=2609468 RepID=UPI00104DA372